MNIIKTILISAALLLTPMAAMAADIATELKTLEIYKAQVDPLMTIAQLDSISAHALVNALQAKTGSEPVPAESYDGAIVAKMPGKSIVVIGLTKDGQVTKAAALPLYVYESVVKEASVSGN